MTGELVYHLDGGRGISIGLAYWLAINLIGAAFTVVNLRALRSIDRTLKPDEPELRTETRGRLWHQIVIGAFVLLFGGVGVLLARVSLTTGLDMEFPDTATAHVATYVTLTAVSVAPVTAVGFWIIRRLTLRAIRRRR